MPICVRCGQDKPITEFHASRREKTGHVNRCKPCVAEYQKEYRAKYAERISEKRRADYADRADVHRERARQYQASHPEQRHERDKTRYERLKAEYQQECEQPSAVLTCLKCGKSGTVEAFKPQSAFRAGLCTECFRADRRQREANYRADPSRDRSEKAREYRQQHAEHYREWQHQRYHDDPSRVVGYNNARRARRQNAPAVARIRRADIIARDHSTCYLCGKLLMPKHITLDHVVPLVRGGSHIPDNLRVACRSCNSRKRESLLSELVASGRWQDGKWLK